LKRIVAVRPYYDEADFMRLKWHIEDREVQYRFPGRTEDEAWRFTCVGRILSEIYTAIKDGVTVTKRYSVIETMSESLLTKQGYLLP